MIIKKKNNYFFSILFALFVAFLSLMLAYDSGYYEANMSRKAKITNEKIEEFERDVKNNENIDTKSYVETNTVDYSSSVSKLGSNLSNTLNNFIEHNLGDIFNAFARLFT